MTVTLCLVLLMLGSTPSGLSEGPLGRVWPSLPHPTEGALGKPPKQLPGEIQTGDNRVGRGFANGMADRGSIPGLVIPKAQ